MENVEDMDRSRENIIKLYKRGKRPWWIAWKLGYARTTVKIYLNKWRRGELEL